mgnify:CR=1 FL=1
MPRYSLNIQDDIDRELITLMLEAEAKHSHNRELSNSDKWKYIIKAFNFYVYYEWYCYYMKPEEYKKYRLMKAVYQEQKRINEKPRNISM